MSDEDVKVSFGATVDGAIAGINQVTQSLESFGANIEGLAAPLAAFGEAAVAAFAVEKMQHFIESVTDLGVQIERTSQQLGISTETVGELNAAAQFSDTSLENMRNSMARFDLISQEAAKGTGNGAAAFKTLGINVRDAAGQMKDPQVLFGEISEKFKETADNGNKTAIAMALFGRQGKDLIPILDQGKEGMEQMRQVAIRTGTLFSQDLVDAMHSTHDETVELGLAQAGLQNTMFTLLKPAIDLVEQAMVGMTEYFNDAVKHSDTLKFAISSLVVVLKGFESGVLVFATAIESSLKLVEASVVSLQVAITQGYSAGKKSYDNYMKQILTDNDQTWNKIKQLWSDDPVTAAQKNKPSVGNLGDNLNAEKAMKDDIEKHKAMLSEEVADVGQNLQAKMVLQQQYYDWLKAKYPQNAVAISEAGRQIAQTQDQEAKQSAQSWDRFFNSFNSGIMGMIRGTESFKQSLSNMFMHVIELALKAVEKLVANWISGEITKSAATNAGNAQRTSSNLAAAAAGKAIQKADDSTSVLASAHTGAASAYASTAAIPIIGPILAPAAAAAAFGAIVAFDSFETGTPYVPKTGPYILHEGEEVRPAGVQNSGGGGPDVHFHVSAMDSQSVEQFFNTHGGKIAHQMVEQYKRGSPALTRYTR